jgi:histidinol-phosphate aminotransferase
MMRFIPALEGMVPYEPGRPIEVVQREYGLSHVVKLASNEFPLPPFPEVKAAIVAAIDDLNRYPEGPSTELREALAVHYGRTPEEIPVGAGSLELLMLLGQALLEPGDEVVYASPSFTSYEDICLAHAVPSPPVPLAGFTHDLEAMAAAVTPRTKMVMICNPNNPTGTYVPAAAIKRLVEAVPEDVVVVVDEAYNEFVTAPDSQDTLPLQAEHPNVAVFRTFSKIYGLCGLRVGYALCSPLITEAMHKLRQPFNVNRLAQVAALEALKHQDQVTLRREQNARERHKLVARLAERGRATVPSEANFMLVDARGLRCPQEDVFTALLAMGVIVRDGNSLGCPGWMRVTVGTEAENEFFLEKLAALEVDAPSPIEGRTL